MSELIKNIKYAERLISVDTGDTSKNLKNFLEFEKELKGHKKDINNTFASQNFSFTKDQLQELDFIKKTIKNNRKIINQLIEKL